MVESVAGLLQLMHLAGDSFFTPFVGDALVERARSKSATHFLEKTDADVLLTIDSDIAFDGEDALTICDQAMDYDIVSVVYPTRLAKGGNPASFLDVDEIEFGSDPTPVEVRYAGSGFMAIHRRVFEKLAKRPDMEKCHVNQPSGSFYPFYHTMFTNVSGVGRILLSEDYAFCHRAKEEGFKVYINPAIRLAHVGHYHYRLEDWVWQTPGRQDLVMKRNKNSKGRQECLIGPKASPQQEAKR